MVNSIDRNAVTELMKGYYFYIPSYQRGYRWTSIQVVQLLSDLLCYASSTFNKRIQGINEGEYYCLQPVVARKITDKEVLKKILPKDAKKEPIKASPSKANFSDNDEEEKMVAMLTASALAKENYPGNVKIKSIKRIG